MKGEFLNIRYLLKFQGLGLLNLGVDCVGKIPFDYNFGLSTADLLYDVHWNIVSV